MTKGDPSEAANFSLVSLVGCLVQGPGDSWSVENASAPSVTKDSSPSRGDDLNSAASHPLGSQRFTLLSVFVPLAEHAGHKMEVKGLLIRRPNDDRINVVSVQMVAPDCRS